MAAIPHYPEAVTLLKNLGLSPHHATFSAAAAMLTGTISLSDSKALETKQLFLTRAVGDLKDALGAKKSTAVCPLAAMLLASNLATNEAQKADDTAREAAEKEDAVIRDVLRVYVDKVKAGEVSPETAAVQMVAECEATIGRELNGLHDAALKRFIEVKPAEKPVEPEQVIVVPPPELPTA